MARTKRPAYAGPSYMSPQFRPYALALGQLALAWNEFHEMLSLLFCTTMGGGNSGQFLAIWHALKSDRSQRDILLVAANADIHHGIPEATYQKLKESVKFLCKTATKLEDLRNDALHCPLFGSSAGIQPLTGLGHVRANKLAAKNNLLDDFRWCRDCTLVLTQHIRNIQY
jgi:hypothetical protein